MATNRVSYSDDVWKAIRLIWEASPSTVSWRVILEQVATAMSCDVPSIPTASMRCKTEGWKKSLKKSLKKGAKNVTKNMQDFSPANDIKNEIKTVICEDYFGNEDSEILGLKIPKKVHGELVASEGMERIEKAAKKANNSTEEMVEKMRSSQVGMFNVNVTCITQLQDFLAKVIEAESLEELELLRAQMAMIAGAADMGETLSKTQERVLKGLIGLHGLDPDSFKDREQSKSIRDKTMLELDAKIDQVKREMKANKAKALARDIRAMEEGALTPSDAEIEGIMSDDDSGLNEDGRDNEH